MMLQLLSRHRQIFVRQCRSFLALILLCFGSAESLWASPAAEAAEKITGNAKKVLVLFSEVQDLPGNTMLEQALRLEMQKSSTNQLEFFAEDFDAARFRAASHDRLFHDYLAEKYKDENLDLIVAFMARDFLLTNEFSAPIFSRLPVVFVAITQMEIPENLGRTNVSGIVQRFDVAGTLKLMSRLRPDVHHVVVIGGVSATDHLSLRRIENEARTFEGVDFEFWTNRPISAMREALASLPPETAILLSSVERDISGQRFYTFHVAAALAPIANAPMFVLTAGSLGSGAVGGQVVDFTSLGTSAGKMATRILSGESPGAVSIEERTKGTPMIDWRAMKRWSIPLGRLPRGSVTRFQPDSLWENYRWYFVAGLGVLIAQALTIAGLVTQRGMRRRAESELQAQRIELAHVARVSTLGQLATSLAHELTQPLGAILRNAEAAEMFLQNPQPDLGELKAIVADIRKDDERAGGVIDRMRSLLKRRSIETATLDLSELLEDTIRLARIDGEARKTRIELELPPGPAEVSGDRVHLQQVLLNLILNGLDAMNHSEPENRLLTVRLEAASEGKWRVSVSDHGTGISSAAVAQVFQPFFTTKPKGLGMGLAISRTIIESHGGEIFAVNNTGGGATFAFTLPAAHKNA